jgi:hypothetical protein
MSVTAIVVSFAIALATAIALSAVLRIAADRGVDPVGTIASWFRPTPALNGGGGVAPIPLPSSIEGMEVVA